MRSQSNTLFPHESVDERHKHYFHIAQHYKYALSRVLLQDETVAIDHSAMQHSNREKQFSHAIVLEEDVAISADFFHYMEAMRPLLRSEANSLFCISAFNDNGMHDKLPSIDGRNASVFTTAHRTDFFPGLGWMTTREFFIAIYKDWPLAYVF